LNENSIKNSLLRLDIPKYTDKKVSVYNITNGNGVMTSGLNAGIELKHTKTEPYMFFKREFSHSHPNLNPFEIEKVY